MVQGDDPSVPAGEIGEWLNEHRDAGHFREFGGSNWRPERVDEANAHAKRRGLRGMVAVSNYLGLAIANEPMWRGCVMTDEAGLRWHEATGTPNFVWSSQARGFFSGRFKADDPSDPDMVRAYYNKENWERLARAERLGVERGLSATQVALAYVLNQRFPSIALVGPANVDELRQCAAAAETTLSAEEMAWLERGGPRP